MPTQLLAVSQDDGQDCCQAVSVSLFHITTGTWWLFCYAICYNILNISFHMTLGKVK